MTASTPIGVRMVDGATERAAPPLPKGSSGSRFSSTMRFQPVRLPTVPLSSTFRRGVRLQPIYSQRWLAIPPAEDELRNLSHTAPLTTSQFASSWDSQQLEMVPVRQPGYLLVGQRMTPHSRRDMMQEELLHSERLGLAPAPELYFGRGFAGEPKSVRLRRLRVDTRQRQHASGTARPTSTAQMQEPIPEAPVDDENEESRAGDLETDAGDAEDGRAEDAAENDAAEGTEADAGNDEDDDEGNESAQSSATAAGPDAVSATDISVAPTGWEGTVLDPSTAPPNEPVGESAVAVGDGDSENNGHESDGRVNAQDSEMRDPATTE